jgi:hypothetical protein
MYKRLVGHHGPQVGAADPDVDDVSDGFSGVPLPVAISNAAAEACHPVQHLVHMGHHVFPVHQDLGPFRRPKGCVQHGSFFGDVDLFPPDHGVNAVLEAAFPGQFQKQGKGFVGDAVFGIIQVKARTFRGHPLAAVGVLFKKRAEMEISDFFMVLFQGLPSRSTRQGCCFHCHI